MYLVCMNDTWYVAGTFCTEDGTESRCIATSQSFNFSRPKLYSDFPFRLGPYHRLTA